MSSSSASHMSCTALSGGLSSCSAGSPSAEARWKPRRQPMSTPCPVSSSCVRRSWKEARTPSIASRALRGDMPKTCAARRTEICPIRCGRSSETNASHVDARWAAAVSAAVAMRLRWKAMTSTSSCTGTPPAACCSAAGSMRSAPGCDLRTRPELTERNCATTVSGGGGGVPLACATRHASTRTCCSSSVIATTSESVWSSGLLPASSPRMRAQLAWWMGSCASVA
mmetsp:Transcript_18604/g.46610  ORF Transcript_18604/g.46610 Transcript_18604/m.46610 type:complete len:226 (+) Transcript_18604:532-1209(+)